MGIDSMGQSRPRRLQPGRQQPIHVHEAADTDHMNNEQSRRTPRHASATAAARQRPQHESSTPRRKASPRPLSGRAAPPSAGSTRADSSVAQRAADLSVAQRAADSAALPPHQSPQLSVTSPQLSPPVVPRLRLPLPSHTAHCGAHDGKCGMVGLTADGRHDRPGDRGQATWADGRHHRPGDRGQATWADGRHHRPGDRGQATWADGSRHHRLGGSAKMPPGGTKGGAVVSCVSRGSSAGEAAVSMAAQAGSKSERAASPPAADREGTLLTRQPPLDQARAQAHVEQGQGCTLVVGESRAVEQGWAPQAGVDAGEASVRQVGLEAEPRPILDPAQALHGVPGGASLRSKIMQRGF